MSRLLGKLKNGFPPHIRFRLIATYSDYIGDENASLAARCIQPVLFFCSVVKILLGTLSKRSTIFHVHFSQRGSTLRKGLICVLLRVRRCRYVVHAHASEDALFHEWVPNLVRMLLLWGISGGRYIIALTQFWRDYYVEKLKLPVTKVLVLPNPAEIPPVIPDRTHAERLNLLFLGRIGARKGAFDVIHAFAALPDSVRLRCHLTLAGDGEIATARSLVAQLDCSAQASVLGWVRGEQVDRLLAEADMLLLPSRGEGMAVALLEGMAWGVAVVATAVGGANEFLRANHNCVLVDPGDVGAISEAIRALALDRELRFRLGKEARHTANQFSIDRYIKSLTRLYEELAAGPRSTNGGRA
jgi:glycosyltransferase involved in cell wall biosynthesis